MLMRSCLLIMVILSLTSCMHRHHTQATIKSPQHNGPITPFTRVQIKGDIDVTLSTGKTSNVSLHADPRDKDGVFMNVTNGTLYISVGKGYPHYGSIHADIQTHYLSSIVYRGKGTLIGKNIRSGLLDVRLANKGKTVLQGQMAIRNLVVSSSGVTQISGITGHLLQVTLTDKPHVQLAGVVEASSLHVKDHAWLSIYWLKGRETMIRATGNAFIQTAGLVDRLDVVLRKHAHYNGRYLRGRRVFVKTYDHSVADISTIGVQHTLASDRSNIYQHNIPALRTDFMAENGAVLDMREWELPYTIPIFQFNQ